MINLVEVLFGFILGIIASFLMIYVQFAASFTAYRVRMVREATKLIIYENRNNNISALRNQYRFSLGVIINQLTAIDSEGMQIDGDYPTLINCEGDRWAHFMKEVKPVIDDLNPYSLVGVLGFKYFPNNDCKRLSRLFELCQSIETVVSILDAVSEYKDPSIIKCQDNGILLNQEIDQNDDRIQSIKQAYRELYTAWNAWLKAC